MARVYRDDLPVVSASPLRALGVISAAATSTVVRFGELEFPVLVAHRRFPNGGDWAFFLCPGCSRRVRKLWLLSLSAGCGPRCDWCCVDRDVRWRIESMSVRRRAEINAVNLAARLESKAPARLHPRPGRALDRRKRLEAVLARAKYVVAEGWISEAGDADGEGSGQLR
jgi:hypothetical protein